MGKPWFRVKRYGVGAGLPCSWEGWAVGGMFLAVIVVTGALPREHAGLRVATILITTAVFCVVARLKSDAPWKWRWGRE